MGLGGGINESGTAMLAHGQSSQQDESLFTHPERRRAGLRPLRLSPLVVEGGDIGQDWAGMDGAKHRRAKSQRG